MDPSKVPLDQIELLVLRAMCQETRQGSVRAEAGKLLAHYVWREPVYQAMFNCLASVPSVEPDDLRRGLLVCLTRRGFPDVDLEIFLQPHGLSRQESEQLIQHLIAAN